MRNKIIVFLMIITFGLCLNACAKCSHKPPKDNPGNNTATTQTVEPKDTVPEWLVIDSNMIDDCVAYYSKNIIYDTTSAFNCFPFVVIDTLGNKGMFFIVSLKRYDLLYINQVGVMDENNHVASAGYVEKVGLKDQFESTLFILEPIECDLVLKFDGNLSFNGWGLFGSSMQKLDSVQTENFRELVKLSL